MKSYCSVAVSAEVPSIGKNLKTSPVMVMSPYEGKILDWYVKQKKNNKKKEQLSFKRMSVVTIDVTH